jgi:hypothetical protein
MESSQHWERDGDVLIWQRCGDLLERRQSQPLEKQSSLQLLEIAVHPTKIRQLPQAMS